MSSSSLCKYLEWDSDHFGVRIGRILPETLDAADLGRAQSWAKEQRIDCLYFLCDAADIASIARVEEAGFHLTDLRVTFNVKVPVDTSPSSNAALIRSAVESDLAALKAIARVSHRDSRFYADPHFPRDKCDLLYEKWIENSCGGWAEEVLLVAPTGKPLGYISCHLPNEAEGKIGLVATAESAQGQGLGSMLVGQALNWFAEHGRQTVSVVTQGANVRAQRFYQRAGFRTRSVQCWFHWWR